MSKIRVFIKEPKKKAEVKEIENTLSSLQKIVDGYIEVVPFTNDGTHLIINEEGKLTGLPYNFPYYDDFIVGTAIFTKSDDEGEFSGLTDEDINGLQEEYPYLFI